MATRNANVPPMMIACAFHGVPFISQNGIESVNERSPNTPLQAPTEVNERWSSRI
jgi:hypothetical protein